jgi:hypothetical protein
MYSHRYRSFFLDGQERTARSFRLWTRSRPQLVSQEISFYCCEPFKRNSGECCEAPVGRKIPPYLHVLKPKGGCRAMLKAGASRFGKYLADKRHRYVSKVQKIASRSPLSRTGTAGSAVVGVIESITMSAPSPSRSRWCQATETQKQQLFSNARRKDSYATRLVHLLFLCLTHFC